VAQGSLGVGSSGSLREPEKWGKWCLQIVEQAPQGGRAFSEERMKQGCFGNKEEVLEFVGPEPGEG